MLGNRNRGGNVGGNGTSHSRDWLLSLVVQGTMFALLLGILLYKFDDEVGKLRESIEQRFDKVEQRFDKVEQRIDQNQEISLLIQEEEHDFVKDRIKTCSAVSLPYLFSSKYGAPERGTTSVALYYRGYVAVGTVTHFYIPNNLTEMVRSELEQSLSTCEGIDWAVIPHVCPFQEFALNITLEANMEEGDPLVSYGFHDYYRGWSGTLGAHYFQKEGVNHFGEYPLVSPLEFSVVGTQGAKQSGALSLNGAGVMGIIHAIKTHSPVSLLIPVSLIKQCLDEKITQNILKHYNDCNIKIIQPPISTLSKIVRKRKLKKYSLEI